MLALYPELTFYLKRSLIFEPVFKIKYSFKKLIVMSDGSRIPRGIDEFNPYIINTSNYMLEGTPTNAERLGVLTSESAQWTGFITDWNPLYAKYSDKKNGRTTAVKDQLLAIIDQCVLLDQTSRILDRVASSPNVTIVDMETFRIKKGVLQKTTRSFSTTPISETPIAAVQPLGGGSLAIKCHSNTSRASILDGADSVQYVYAVGDTPPASADVQGLSKELTTKASFTLALGAGSSAKYLYIYFRWYNTKHPELASPWSAMVTTLIL
jgi:hypothetical protein